jgi:hypothetical protein
MDQAQAKCPKVLKNVPRQDAPRAAIKQPALATFGGGVLVIECPRYRESREARVDNLISRLGGQHKMGEVVARLRW